LLGVKQSLTTADKKPSKRLEFSQEIVCKKYVSASAETQVLEDEFSGTLTSSELGSLIVAELDAPLHFWSRSLVTSETMARKSLSSASFERARDS
jgi:hypothetical protein